MHNDCTQEPKAETKYQDGCDQAPQKATASTMELPAPPKWYQLAFALSKQAARLYLFPVSHHDSDILRASMVTHAKQIIAELQPQ